MKELNKWKKSELIKELERLKVQNKIIKVGNRKIEVMPIEQKEVCFKELKIPKGWRLPNMVEAFAIYDNKLEDFDSGNNDFFIEQPSVRLKKLGKVALLIAVSDLALLYCGRDPANSDVRLGAIFVRDLKKS